MKKFYIIAGESSGELHGSNLIKALRNQDNETEFRVWGGDRMKEAGAKVVRDYREMNFMGFSEVLANLSTILDAIRFCKQDIRDYKPDAVVLIDYPGFNMRIAKYVKKLGIPVFYYISPQIWAWKKGRVHQLKKTVDEMFVILPFEKDFYADYDMDVHYVGHPLLDAIEAFNPESSNSSNQIIALLPGSRMQEVKKMLPIMLGVVERFPELNFQVAASSSIPKSTYGEILGTSGVTCSEMSTYQLLSESHAALVTSGTATLETALFQVPQVVCYKGSPISVWLAKRLVNIKYISLVNLILDQPVVSELIQADLKADRLESELNSILAGSGRDQMIDSYADLREKLGGGGASELTASLMLKTLEGTAN